MVKIQKISKIILEAKTCGCSYISSHQKWFFPIENLKIGGVVMVIDVCAARREWKDCCIELTYLGSDQLVRVVDVQVGDKVLK